RRPSLALEEAARDLPGGVHPLFDVDREREEVRALARLHPALRGRKHHRVARPDDDCAVGLLRELPRLERDLAPADRHADVREALNGNRHMSVPPLCFVRVGTRVSVADGARSNLPSLLLRDYLRSPSSLISARYPSRSCFWRYVRNRRRRPTSLSSPRRE